MNERKPSIETWLSETLSSDVQQAVRRMAEVPGVRRIAVMPDVHLAEHVCVGTVVATDRVLFPRAVGGDIGCGILAVPLPWSVEQLLSRVAAVFEFLREGVPTHRLPRRADLPLDLLPDGLSHERLRKIAMRDGRVQLGTLGRGNHFLEFQADQADALWLTIHSGSRGIGQAVTEHHLADAQLRSSSLASLDAESDAGRSYLADLSWCRRYAAANRLAMSRAVCGFLGNVFGGDAFGDDVCAQDRQSIHSDHNHVQLEVHDGEPLWVHRKGALSAREGEAGVIPGSMGTESYHVVGRGCSRALHSSSHGAGRRLSRGAAKREISSARLGESMRGIAFDVARLDQLRDESPAAYKDIRRVMRAQRQLTRISRVLRPILVHKGFD